MRIVICICVHFFMKMYEKCKVIFYKNFTISKIVACANNYPEGSCMCKQPSKEKKGKGIRDLELGVWAQGRRGVERSSPFPPGEKKIP